MNALVNVAAVEEYIMGRAAATYDRLYRQDRIWEPITQRILLEAGLQKGMRCLVVGSGAGSTMGLLGTIAGNQGSVTGYDTDWELGDYAVDLLNSRGRGQFFFLQGDIEKTDELPGAPYDFVYSRFLLSRLENPEDAVKKMFHALKPGGTLLLQDYDFSTLHFSESVKYIDVHFRELMTEALGRMGRDPVMGIRLSDYFTSVLGKGADLTDESGVISTAAEALAMMRSVYESMLPVLKKLDIADEDDFMSFCRLAESILPNLKEVTAFWPLLGSAWIKRMITPGYFKEVLIHERYEKLK